MSRPSAAPRPSAPPPSDSSAAMFEASCEGFFSHNDPFHVIRSRFNSREPHLFQANIVLSALTAVLKQENSDWRTQTKSALGSSYFACLMLALEKSLLTLAPQLKVANQLAESIESLGDGAPGELELLEGKFSSLDSKIQAIIGQTVEPMTFLLSVLLESVSPAVLKSKQELSVGVLLAILSDYQANQRITRAVITSFELLLSVPDTGLCTNAYWGNSARVGALQSLLVYSIDARPKIRHTAQQATARVFHKFVEFSLENNQQKANEKAISSGVPKVVQELLVQFVERELTAFQENRGEGGDSFREPLHLCGLLQQIIYLMAPKPVQAILAALFRVFGVSSVSSTVQVTSSVSVLFVQLMRTMSACVNPAEIHSGNSLQIDRMDNLVRFVQERQETADPAKYSAFVDQLIASLHGVQPHVNDVDPNLAYFHALEFLFIRQAKCNQALFLASFNRAFPIFSDRLASIKPPITRASGAILAKLAKLVDFTKAPHEAAATFHQTFLGHLDSLLHFRFKASFALIFPVFIAYFSLVPITQFPSLIPLLHKLDQMKSGGQIGLDELFGSLFLYFGVERVLAVLPLELPLTKEPPASRDEDNTENSFGASVLAGLERSRSSFLPILKTFVRHSELSYFLSEFLPVALRLHELEQKCSAAEFLTEARAFQTLRDQVWEVLAAFCYLPIDCPASFKAFGKRVGEILSNQAFQYCHLPICKALTMLVRKFQQRVEEEKASQQMSSGEENVEESEELAKVLNEEESDEEESSEGESAQPSKKKQNIKKPSRANEEAKNKSAQRYSISMPPHLVLPKPSVSGAAAEESLLTISSYAKNLLPVLFNLVTFNATRAAANAPGAQAATHVEPILEAIQAFASVSDAATLNNLFKSALKKLLEASAATHLKAQERENDKEIHKEQQRTHVLSDIVLAMSGSLSPENVAWLYKTIIPQLSDSDPVMQKKAYKILSRLIECHNEWFQAEWRAIVEILGSAQEKLANSATKTRISCLKAILMRVPMLVEAQSDVLKTILPHFTAEILFCCKDPAIRTRDQAYAVLVETARLLTGISLTPERLASLGLTAEALNSPQPLLYEFVIIILSGLIGRSQTMQSATVLALASLLYHFKTIFSQEIIQSIFSNVLPLLHTESREIVKSVLGFSKVAILALHPDILKNTLPELLDGLVLWCNKRKNRFKPKIRKLLEIVMRKFSFDVVQSLVPKQHWPLLEHIKKEKEKEKREKANQWAQRVAQQKNARGAGVSAPSGSHKQEEKEKSQKFERIVYGSDEEVDEPEDQRKRRPKKSKNRSDGAPAVLIEDENADFLDRGVMSKIQTGKYANQNSQPILGGPKRQEMAKNVQKDETGKFVFNEDEDASMDEEDEKGRASHGRLNLTSMNHVTEEARRLGLNLSKKRNRNGDEEGEDRNGKKSRGPNAKTSYLALDPNSLNRRKKFSAVQRFESVVNAAKQGANKATKVKENQKHKGVNKKQKKHK